MIFNVQQETRNRTSNPRHEQGANKMLGVAMKRAEQQQHNA
jgi:hypothetical protein